MDRKLSYLCTYGTSISSQLDGVGPPKNYVPLDTPFSGTRESRSAIKTELSGKLVFNDTTVFDRLGTDSISAVFVARCADSFSSNSKIVAAISELQSLAKAADSKSIEQLEREVTDEDGSRKKKKRDEPKMYPHLVDSYSSHICLPIDYLTRKSYSITLAISRVALILGSLLPRGMGI